MNNSHINIKFPFQENSKGFYFDSNINTLDAIKSDILHMLLTRKGDRFYDPNFGTSLYMYLFEPNDDITISDIKREANECLAYSMPNIEIINIDVNREENSFDLKIIAKDSDDVYLENIEIEVVL